MFEVPSGGELGAIARPNAASAATAETTIAINVKEGAPATAAAPAYGVQHPVDEPRVELLFVGVREGPKRHSSVTIAF